MPTGPSSLADAVGAVCRDVIAPAALGVDSDVVPRSHLDALAPTGIFAGPTAGGLTRADVRAAHERVAGACLSTWFVLAQHQSPVQLVRSAPEPLRSSVLPLLESGTSLAGIAFSHLRQWPHRLVEVERSGRSWRFSGTAPWFTGWGINDVAVVAGATADGEAVFALVPSEAGPGLRPGDPLETVAVSAARTVPLVLDGLVVPDEGVLCVVGMQRWLVDDRAKTANATPSVFGVAAAALDRLRSGPDAAGRQAAARLAGRLADVRGEAYSLIDEVEPDQELDRRLRLRAEALQLCLQATSALVVSRGGRAMLRSDDAQLLARWALFLTVQAQTAPLRAALVSRLTS